MGRVRRWQVPTILLIELLALLAILTLPCRVGAQTGKTTPAERPGDAPYTPTRLEWAALELQAGFGSNTWTSETPVMINYTATDDGTTVLCLLQYTPDTPAQVVKINRDAAQHVFDKYVASHGWEWLRLRYEERILSR